MATSWERLRTSVAALVLANLVPFVGVLALGWELHSLLVVYWLESAVVGALTIPKMVRAADPDAPARPDSFAGLADLAGAEDGTVALVSLVALFGRIAFFCVHYGLFWVVHGAFVLRFPTFFADLAWASPRVVATGAVGLLVSHVVSYRRDYVAGREYEQTTPEELMSAPYRRVLVLHLTVLGGAVGAAAVGVPLAALALMVVVKTALDLRGYWREHVRTTRRLPV
jgi:hypothetical protein